MRLPLGVDIPLTDDSVLRCPAKPVGAMECRCGVVLPCEARTPSGAFTHVALKVLSLAAMAASGDDWRAEVTAMSLLQPVGIAAEARATAGVPRWDVVVDDDNVYIVTEWGAHGTLMSWTRRTIRDLVAARGQEAGLGHWFSVVLPVLAYQLSATMAAMHERGVVHLDWDPHNIVVAEPVPGDLQLLAIDFGSARAVKSLDGSGSAVGDSGVKFKPRFVAPEAFDHLKTAAPFGGPAADRWALGTTLWWLIAVPVALVNDEPERGLDERVLDGMRAWHDNLTGHCAGEHAAQHAECDAARARYVEERDAALLKGVEAPPQPARVPGECLLCRWNLSLPEEWQVLLFRLLAIEPAARAQPADALAHCAMIARAVCGSVEAVEDEEPRVEADAGASAGASSCSGTSGGCSGGAGASSVATTVSAVSSASTVAAGPAGGGHSLGSAGSLGMYDARVTACAAATEPVPSSSPVLESEW